MKLLLPAAPEGIDLVVSPVGALPEDLLTWARQQLPGGALHAASPITTDAGWPATLFEGEVPGQHVVLVAYRFLELGALLVVHCPAPLFAARREQILELARAGAIDWEGQPLLTLAQIWEGFVDS